PLAGSSSEQITKTQALADPTKLVTLAKGLSAHVVASSPALGTAPDQMALWPSRTNPQWIIACNEEEGPSLVRVRIADGHTETILNDLSECDPVRATDWGTV